MTDPRALALAALPIVAAAAAATPEGRRDAALLAGDLDADTARDLVVLLASAYAGANPPTTFRPLVQAVLLDLHAGDPP